MLNPGWEDLNFQDDCLWRASLDYGAWFHLGKRKHTAGRDMINVSMPHRKILAGFGWIYQSRGESEGNARESGESASV